jgi:hypothetical protein
MSFLKRFTPRLRPLPIPNMSLEARYLVFLETFGVFCSRVGPLLPYRYCRWWGPAARGTLHRSKSAQKVLFPAKLFPAKLFTAFVISIMGVGLDLTDACSWWNSGHHLYKDANQRVTKRRRLSWQTNSALVYEPKCGGRGGGFGRGLCQ